MGGIPVIRGTRLSVEQVLEMLAAGDTPESLVASFPNIVDEDVRACLVFAQQQVQRHRTRASRSAGVVAGRMTRGAAARG
jgi:uncharacterized protein (DUF433 family)